MPPDDTLEALNPAAAILIATMEDRHEDMAELLAGLPDGALDWSPAAQANSLADLARHILDIEGHVLRELAGGDLAWSGANGSQLDAPADAALLAGLLAEVESGLRPLLAAVGPGETASLSVALEEFDHCAMHYGQMQLTRHLWEAAHPAEHSTYEHWR